MNFDHQQCLEDTQTDGRACPRNSEPLKCEELDTDSPIVSPRIGSNRLQPWSNFNRWLWNRASMGIPVIHWFIGLSSLSQQPFWQHAPIFRQAQWTSISSCWYICYVSHDIPLIFFPYMELPKWGYTKSSKFDHDLVMKRHETTMVTRGSSILRTPHIAVVILNASCRRFVLARSKFAHVGNNWCYRAA